MFNLAPYVESWMDRLGKERPLFHSESDFQLALATVMADEVEQVRLEKKVAVSERVGGRPRLAVDVLGRPRWSSYRVGAEVPEEASAGGRRR